MDYRLSKLTFRLAVPTTELRLLTKQSMLNVWQEQHKHKKQSFCFHITLLDELTINSDNANVAIIIICLNSLPVTLYETLLQQHRTWPCHGSQQLLCSFVVLTKLQSRCHRQWCRQAGPLSLTTLQPCVGFALTSLCHHSPCHCHIHCLTDNSPSSANNISASSSLHPQDKCLLVKPTVGISVGLQINAYTNLQFI